MSRRKRLAALFVVGAVAAMGGCGSAASDETAAPPAEPMPGALVIVGGALAADNAAVYGEVLDGVEGSGKVCVLPTASGVPDESMAAAVARLDEWGRGPGTAIGISITEDTPDRADDPMVVSRLRACGGFFFTGGSQSRIVDTFLPEGRPTAAYDALMERWRAGAVVAGTSAGAAMMGRWIISGGSSIAAFESGVGEGVRVRPGMGFFDDGWLDQHFLARGRWGRLLVAALDADPYAVGFGIDENTALVVRNGRARVVGASGVVVIDARAAAGEAVVDGVLLQLLGDGDTIDLRTLDVSRDPGRVGLADETRPAEASGDPFAPRQLLVDLAAIAATGESVTYAVPDGSTLEVARGPAFQAGAASRDQARMNPAAPPFGLSAGPFTVRLSRSLGG